MAEAGTPEDAESRVIEVRDGEPDSGSTPSASEKKVQYDHTCESIYCRKPGVLRCHDCESVYYCDRTHQKADWKTHKAWCTLSRKKRALTVDGYRLCDAVLKANDAVQIALTNKHFERVDYSSETELLVRSAVEAEQPAVQELAEADDADGDVQHRQYRLVYTAYDYGNLRNSESLKAYWAFRSCVSTFLLNTTLFYLLQHYKAHGYRQVVFGSDVTLSLADSAPEMRSLVLEPTMRVHIDERPDADASREVALMCVALDGHTLDLSAGRFWRFEQRQFRPLYLAPDKEFVRSLGRFVRDYRPKAVALQRERMYTTNIENVIDGASVYKLALLHLGLPLDHNCPVRFRNVEIRTQQQRMAALFLVTDDRFQQLVEKYMQASDSRLVQTVNVMGHCADAVAEHGSLEKALLADDIAAAESNNNDEDVDDEDKDPYDRLQYVKASTTH